MMQNKPNNTLRVCLAVGAALGLGGTYWAMTAWSTPTAASVPPAQIRQAAAPAPLSAPAVGPGNYLNPVIDRNFPDPSVLRDRGAYYTYATNGDGGTLPCARSVDLVHWTMLPDAMPTLPAWVIPGRTWAPQVAAFVPGKRYVAYFTAHDKGSDSQEIGVAVASSPAGPFVGAGNGPLIDQRDLGGAIDASCFDDNGTHYLVWKNDGNSRGQDTWLWGQKLSADGLTLVGTPTKLIKQDQPWEGKLIEAPTLWKHGAKYYLFYSANFYGNCSYAMGYAVAPSPLGPFVKPRTTPWLSSTSDVCGPGGQDIVTAGDGRTWMAYHMWAKGPGSYRSTSVDPLVWNGDVPYLLGPSRWAQPAPARLPEASK